jgi:hypothetical protein
MTDNNNVVIKINYKASNKSPYKRSDAETVAEWHYKRIIIALILFITFIVFPFYYFSGDSVEQQAEGLASVTEDKPVVNNILKAVDKEPVKLETVKETKKDVNTVIDNTIKPIKKEQTVIDIKPVDKIKTEERSKPEINPSRSLVDKRIVRALLTTGVKNKEPLKTIVSPLTVNKKNKVIRVFYFTEIVDMKGQDLYHHWMRNDRLMFTRKISIFGNRWRAATSKTIPYSKAGNWSVRLVNNSDVVLNEIKFEVIQK